MSSATVEGPYAGTTPGSTTVQSDCENDMDSPAERDHTLIMSPCALMTHDATAVQAMSQAHDRRSASPPLTGVCSGRVRLAPCCVFVVRHSQNRCHAHVVSC